MGKYKDQRVMTHPYTRYAQAVIMVENDLSSCDEISANHISNELQKGFSAFRLAPDSSYEGKEKVGYVYTQEPKGNTDHGIYLSPNIISTDKLAKNIWVEGHNIIAKLKKQELSKSDDVKMSIAPIAGEFLSFSLKGSIGRGKPKSTLEEIGLNAVTTVTTMTPCLQYRINKKPRPELFNICIIPDLPLGDLIDFVKLFKKILFSKAADNLMTGNVRAVEEGKGDKKKIAYAPKRPLIYQGNFPNPPRSSALGSVALLAAIGEFAKEAEVSMLAEKVLESLKDTTMYMIKYGGASTFSYNHHVIDLAKDGKLRVLVDSIYYSQLYKEGKRTAQSMEYQRFDLFSSRFLQLFNRPSFVDFLAFRAEYPYSLEILFNTYFKKMEEINSDIIASARELGKWLNQVAYFAAKAEIKDGTNNYWEELRKVKAKILVELESSTFSAKTGDALIANVVTRAGRLSGMDAPAAAVLFMERTAGGQLALNPAKNLLIAFSRLKNKAEQKDLPDKTENNEYEKEETENFSND